MAVSPGQIVNAATGLAVDLTQVENAELRTMFNLANTVAPQISELLNKVTTGAVSGRYMKYVGTVPGLQNTLSNDQQALVNLISNARNYIYTLSGKAINQSETDNLIQQLPRLEYTNDQNRTQIANFTKQLNSIFDTSLELNGWARASKSNGLSPEVIMQEIGSDGDDIMSLGDEFLE